MLGFSQRALDLPGVPAQVGIDGHLYAPELEATEPKAPSGPEGDASPYLGTNTEFAAPAESLGNQGELPLAKPAWVRQKAFWFLAEPESRAQKCHRTRRTTGPVLARRRESGSHRLDGLVKCGSAWCPVCAQGRARAAAAELGACIEAHLSASPYHDVWLAVLTWPHAPMVSLREDFDGGWRAWRHLLKSKRWKALEARYGIISAPRFFEIARSSRGLHAHFNVPIFVKSGSFGLQPLRGMPKEERAEVIRLFESEFREAWEQACKAAGVLPEAKLEDFREHGLRLFPGESSAQYCAKWGLSDEAAKGAVKDRNQFTLLDEYLEGDTRAGALFAEFLDAAKGRQVISGLGKLKIQLGISADDVQAHTERIREARDRHEREAGKEPRPPSVPYTVIIRRSLYRAALDLGWARILALADAAADAGDSPQRAVDAALSARLRELESWLDALE
jgi:hypothetical protein